METVYPDNMYQSEPDKACFQDNMAYGNFK